MMGLPIPILVKRINNELDKCSEYLGTTIPKIPNDHEDFPIVVNISLRNTSGLAEVNGKIEQMNDHRFALLLSSEYGYRRPDVRWLTPIFHPNIMLPEDGGYVCVRTADDWTFSSTLLSFIKSIEQLVMTPNPRNPFGTDSCMHASRYFIENASRIEISVSYGDVR